MSLDDRGLESGPARPLECPRLPPGHRTVLRTRSALMGVCGMSVECVTRVGKLGGVSAGRRKETQRTNVGLWSLGLSPSRNCSAHTGMSQVWNPPSTPSAPAWVGQPLPESEILCSSSQGPPQTAAPHSPPPNSKGRSLL